jgi:hypothetical protein
MVALLAPFSFYDIDHLMTGAISTTVFADIFIPYITKSFQLFFFSKSLYLEGCFNNLFTNVG